MKLGHRAGADCEEHHVMLSVGVRACGYSGQ